MLADTESEISMKKQEVSNNNQHSCMSKLFSVVHLRASHLLLVGFVSQMTLQSVAQTQLNAQLMAPSGAKLKLANLGDAAGAVDSSLPLLSSVQAMAKSIGIKPEYQMELQQQLLGYLSSILNVNVLYVMKSKSISPLQINDLSQIGTQKLELELLVQWALLINANKLESSLQNIVNEVKASSIPQLTAIKAKLNQLSDVQLATVKGMLAASIRAVTGMRGLTTQAKGQAYPEWFSLSETMSSRLTNDLQSNNASNILSLSKSEWSQASAIELLVNGKASFKKRDELLSGAEKTIHILTWSVYDDVTGAALANLLIAKKNKNPQLDIRIIVDGQVAATPGHHVQLDRMEAAGILVNRWSNSKLSYMGQHRKMMLVDGQYMVAGGLNFGDVYSHKNSDLNVPRWRDTDIYVEGAPAVKGEDLFVKMWNEQLTEPHMVKHRSSHMNVATVSATLGASLGATASLSSGGALVSLIDHDPREPQQGSTIMMTILKMIRQAQRSIDIENAYVILFPALAQEIEQAIKDGKTVRVLTNSSESVDEPVVSIPILRSAHALKTMGAQVFVKKGKNTLHSKFMVVDDELAMIMSYNLHPRSERVEGEMAILVQDKAFTKMVKDQFELDIKEDVALSIDDVKQLNIPNSAVSLPSLRIFFDLL